jgi:hypothetical protein
LTLARPVKASVCESRQKAPGEPLEHVSAGVRGAVSVTVGGSWPPPGEAAGSVGTNCALARLAIDGARGDGPAIDAAPLAPTGWPPDVPDPAICGAGGVTAGELGGELELGIAAAEVAAGEGLMIGVGAAGVAADTLSPAGALTGTWVTGAGTAGVVTVETEGASTTSGVVTPAAGIVVAAGAATTGFSGAVGEMLTGGGAEEIVVELGGEIVVEAAGDCDGEPAGGGDDGDELTGTTLGAWFTLAGAVGPTCVVAPAVGAPDAGPELVPVVGALAAPEATSPWAPEPVGAGVDGGAVAGGSVVVGGVLEAAGDPAASVGVGALTAAAAGAVPAGGALAVAAAGAAVPAGEVLAAAGADADAGVFAAGALVPADALAAGAGRDDRGLENEVEVEVEREAAAEVEFDGAGAAVGTTGAAAGTGIGGGAGAMYWTTGANASAAARALTAGFAAAAALPGPDVGKYDVLITGATVRTVRAITMLDAWPRSTGPAEARLTLAALALPGGRATTGGCSVGLSSRGNIAIATPTSGIGRSIARGDSTATAAPARDPAYGSASASRPSNAATRRARRFSPMARCPRSAAAMPAYAGTGIGRIKATPILTRRGEASVSELYARPTTTA